MSTKERAKFILDNLTEEQLTAFVTLFGVNVELPNDETLAAFDEVKNGGGTLYTGSTDDMFTDILEGK